MIVTISGRPGSGKSAVASKVAHALGWRHHSAGDFMRDMAAERGMTILELSRSAERHDTIDREIDARTVQLAEREDEFVIDARLGWHFIPESLKVFLDVTPVEAARRVYEAARGAEHENVSLEDTLAAIESRTESERRRYLDYYHLDYTNHAQFDLVVDTTGRSIDDVVTVIVDHVRAA